MLTTLFGTALIGTLTTAALLVPAAARAADRPDGARPDIGKCKTDVHDVDSESTGKHKAPAKGAKRSPSQVKVGGDSAARDAEARDPGGNQQAFTGGLTVICR